MLQSKKIKKIRAREILDSRGNPTVEVKVTLKNGICGRASVPSGASTGSHEAWELRDGNKKRYLGQGVLKAVNHVNKEIDYLLRNLEISRQQDIDKLMIKLDDTANKKVLGANAILGVSLACARTGSLAYNMPLYKYLRKIYNIHYTHFKMPYTMMNILNGGKHANWALDVQEAMIIPMTGKISKRIQIGSEVFHNLGKLLKEKGFNTFVGDEGGYAVNLKKNEQAFDLILQAIKNSGYKPYKDVNLAVDVAASEFFQAKQKVYKINGQKLTSKKLIDLYTKWLKKYKLLSIEDGLAEDEWPAWQILTKQLGDKCLLVGDDLFVTNKKRLQQGINQHVANAILIKVNQIGSLTETMEAIYMAKQNGYQVIISHRSGETDDTFIADLAVAVNSDFIKTGSLSRSERVSKYNRLMEIEEEIG